MGRLSFSDRVPQYSPVHGRPVGGGNHSSEGDYGSGEL